jgi:hypothetical protein
MLRGLFIGIDKYPAPITRLTCARADALALGSLFEDSSDNGSITKLVDADATRENIVHASKTSRPRTMTTSSSSHSPAMEPMTTASCRSTQTPATSPVRAYPSMNWRFTSMRSPAARCSSSSTAAFREG